LNTLSGGKDITSVGRTNRHNIVYILGRFSPTTDVISSPPLYIMSVERSNRRNICPWEVWWKKL